MKKEARIITFFLTNEVRDQLRDGRWYRTLKHIFSKDSPRDLEIVLVGHKTKRMRSATKLIVKDFLDHQKRGKPTKLTGARRQ